MQLSAPTPSRRRLRLNMPLLLGVTITLIFVTISIIGPQVAPKDPLARWSDFMRFSDDQTIIPTQRPIPPFYTTFFPLGTDHVGRDLLSRLLWAVRPTLLTCLIVVVVRTLLGLPLGLLAGWFTNRWPDRVVSFFGNAIVSIPTLILALILISIHPERPLWLFVTVLALIGWADMMQYVRNQTQIIKQAEFITSAQALGSRTGTILRRHVLPQFWPVLPTLIAFELSAVLLLLAELGFLGLFIGNGMIVMGADPNSPALIAVGLTSGLPELGQMMSDFWGKIFKAPWEMALAASAVFLQVFAFNLVGEGLRKRLDYTRRV